MTVSLKEVDDIRNGAIDNFDEIPRLALCQITNPQCISVGYHQLNKGW